MHFKLASLGIFLLATTMALGGCSKPAPAEEPLRSVKVIMVAEEGLRSSTEYSGEVLARVESRLGFRVGGKIIRRTVELGQRVKAGQLLAQIDAQDYKLSEAAARAQLAAATTNRDLAAADFKRFKDLREQNFISSAELERRESTWKAAQAQFDQAQAQLSSQGNQAAYANLYADAAGVVTAIDAEADQVVAAGTPVVRIAQDGPREVLFSVPEDKVQSVRVGAPAQVTLWASQRQLQGKVREVAASADPATRTFAVRVMLDSKDEVPLGTTVSVTTAALGHAGQSAVTVPTSALVRNGDATAVWVLDSASMTVNLSPVQVQTADGNAVVLAPGLKPGTQVVTAGVHVLTPGQKVSLYQPPRAAAALPGQAAAEAGGASAPQK